MCRLIWTFDGFTSSTLLINYLRKAFPNINITWSNHTKMKHGIDLDLIPETCDLLIVPDAGTNSHEEHKILHDKGIDVIIADHHECEKGYSEHAIVINIQLDDYPNKQISGVGVCMKIIQEIDKVIDKNYHEEFYDLCAFGLLGDAMKINEKETYWMVHKGLNNIKNEFLQELVKGNLDKNDTLTPKAVAFKCNPKVNSLLRVGTQEELDDFMLALTGHQEVTINNRLRSEDKSETWARRMARTMNNTYARQRKLRDKILEEANETIESGKLYENNFITLEIKGEFASNMSGYVAMSLVNKYLRPVIILRGKDDGQLVGSLRGYDPYMADTKSFLKGLNLFSLAEGHPNASGLIIDSDKFELLDEAINKELAHTEIIETYEVDFVMHPNSMTTSFIEDMDKYFHMFGRGIEEPVYAVTSIDVSGDDLQLIGKAENVLKFSKNGVEYVQFTVSEKIKEYVGSDKTLTIDVVVKTSINRFLRKVTPQCVIDAIDIKEVKDSPKGFVFEF